jgi:hypothetical protein
LKKLFIVLVVLTLSACGGGTKLDGAYENENKSVTHAVLTFHSDGTVVVSETVDFLFGKKLPPTMHLYKVTGDKIKIENFGTGDCTIFNDKAFECGYIGTFKKL